MPTPEPWSQLTEAISFAGSCIDDVEGLNERELADGHQYVMRLLHAVSETSLVPFDFDRPAFMAMRESVRHLGAAGPDIDYDVAILAGGQRYRIEGNRGGAAYVGIVVYGAGGDQGASEILDAVDVDTLADKAGSFVFEIDHPAASRVIVRQYFHDRSTQKRGRWQIKRLEQVEGNAPPPLPQRAIVDHRIVTSSDMIRWNAQLNQLWTPERREHPNEFLRLAASDIVAAIPNPDVTYAFTWWCIDEGEALVIDVLPPDTRYWAVQLCDQWFQSYPHRRTNLNDHQVVYRPDGSVRCVLSDVDPGVGNWLDTSGHRSGVVFFRWLHAEPVSLPACRIVPVGELDSEA